MNLAFDMMRMKMSLFSDNAGPDQPALRCPLPESMDTVVYIDGQRMSGSDCTNAYAHLDLRCSPMS